ATVGFQARDHRPGRQVELLEYLAGLGIDPPDVAVLTFPGAVPELAVDPGDAGHEALAFDGAKYRARVRIDLMDLALAVLSDPERAFGPRQSGIAATPGRGDRGEHLACRGVDLLDAILRDLEQVAAIERRARMCGD